MTNWGEFTPATICQIAWEIREGKADPADARQLLELFCKSRSNNIPPELITYLQDSFRCYLEGQKGIEAALGIVRKKGRPAADEEMRQKMAVAILRLRMQEMDHQQCLAKVTKEFHKSESIVSEAWRDHKQDALMLVRLGKALDKYPWTLEEVDRLCTIFQREPWFIAPGKLPIKPKCY